MKILDLPLKAKWYNMIESGGKAEEYREDKPYWRKKLMLCYRSIDWCDDCVSCANCSVSRYRRFRDYTHIRFRYGYTKRTMLFELRKITIGKGKPEWGAPTDKDVFILTLGNRKE